MNGHQLFDRGLMRRRRARAAGRGAGHALIGTVARDIAGRVDEVNRRFARMLEVSAVPGAVAGPLLAAHKVDEAVTALAFAPAGPAPAPSVVIDEEAPAFAPGSFDLIAGALTLHGLNDLPGALGQFLGLLKPDGLFVAALFGGATLSELRQAFAAAEAEIAGGVSPRVMPFAELGVAGRLMQRVGFALPVADRDRLTVRYDSVLALMGDIRAMGEANALAERTRKPMSRALLEAMMREYAARFADPDGRVRATFEIITVTGWRPHESQQRPLRPGSARMRLADALGTREFPAGDPAGSRPPRRK